MLLVNAVSYQIGIVIIRSCKIVKEELKILKLKTKIFERASF